MIPRRVVAAALGLPDGTEALPPGDVTVARFAERLIGYLSSGDMTGSAMDAWTGTVMDSLIAGEPMLALDVLSTGAGMAGGEILSDPLADLAQSGHAGAIAERASEEPPLAALVDAANNG